MSKNLLFSTFIITLLVGCNSGSNVTTPISSVNISRSAAPAPTPATFSGTMSLTLNGSNNYSLYRNNAYPAGVPHDFYGTSPTSFTPFLGFSTSVSWSGSNPAPDAHLVIMSTTGDPACTFNVGALNSQEGVFSIDSNNKTIVLNPDIPVSYFFAGAQVLNCSATVTAYWINNQGAQVFSSPITVSATINPDPAASPPPPPNVPTANAYYVEIQSTGLNTLPNSGYLGIFLNTDYAPLNIPARTAIPVPNPDNINNGIQNGNENDLFLVAATESIPIMIAGTQSAVDESNCFYYSVFSYNGTTGERISINVPTSPNTISTPIIVTATWQRYCHSGESNRTHTISGAVQTKNRFQYGTYQVTMLPSATSGVNSSFYTFFANGLIDNFNWGYTWHEIDFEFLPGMHPVGQAPAYQPYGFFTPYVSPDTLSQSVSLDSFSPGNTVKNAYGANQYHRYCPNPNDPACLVTNFNPFDGKEHTFTVTWDHDYIKYYFDNNLANVLTIQDKYNGTPLNIPANAQIISQMLFNNSGIFDANNKFHPTSPQFISMNFWVPTNRGSFGGVFQNNTIRGSQKIYAKYSNVKWSPCVDDGIFEETCSESANVGKIYNSKGEILEESAQKAYTWDFKHIDILSFLKDWIYAPVTWFDSNNSSFTPNSVLIESGALELCMMNLWDNMATTGHQSIGCDGKMILPSPGESSVTNFDQALLVVDAVGNASQNSFFATATGLIESGVIPKVMTGVEPTMINTGWTNTGTNGCSSNRDVDPGFSCGSSNGWYADPRIESMPDGSYHATFLVQINTKNENFGLTLKPSLPIIINGTPCRVSYNPITLNLAAQKTYKITATMNCNNN